MLLASVTLHPERYPEPERYPFRVPPLQQPGRSALTRPVTVFVGENGTGKSTLLEAIARRRSTHIWRDDSRLRAKHSRWETRLCEDLDAEWANGPAPGRSSAASRS